MRIAINRYTYYCLIALFLSFSSLVILGACKKPIKPDFNSTRAYEDVLYQVDLGPRTMGSQAHAQTEDWIVSELQEAGLDVVIQESSWSGDAIRNIIASRGQGTPWIILGAHYDSRFVADRDPDPRNWSSPVPGANDGASGVAVLLELARSLPNHIDKRIWFVFFDAEDNGNYPGWDWLVGSQAFVRELEGIPDAVVVVDMIGDADLNLYLERASDVSLSMEIWSLANELGYTQFIPEYKYQIIDDHVPFLQAGIRAIDIIDFDYPYWHTVGDTPDKLSVDSLEAVGETLLAWLIR